MSKKISQFKLGLFIISCGALGLTAIIWLGASHYFEEKNTFVTYFGESVKGLQKDAIVNYLGVPVGRVAAIELAPDGRLIEVVMHLKPQFKVDKCLAIRLLEQGLTGLRYLEIAAAPEDTPQVTPLISFSLDYPLIPSYPSEIQQLKAGLESLYMKIIGVDLAGLAERWKLTADLANAILADQDLQATFTRVKTSAEQLQLLLANVNETFPKRGMQRNYEDFNKILEATRKTMETLTRRVQALPPSTLPHLAGRLDQVLKTGESTLAGWDQESAKVLAAMVHNLDQSRQVLEQLRQLVQSLRAQPQQILFHPAGTDPFSGK